MKSPKKTFTTFEAGLLQNQAYRALNTFLSLQLEKENLTVPEWKLLGQLTIKEGQRPSQLAAILDIEPPYATRLVVSLEKKGFVTRRSDPTDERVKQVYLTKKGRLRAAATEKSVRKAMREFMHDVTANELAAYLVVIGKLARKL